MGYNKYTKPNNSYVLSIDGDYFGKSIKLFVPVMWKQCVMCDVAIELLDMIEINFRNQNIKLEGKDVAVDSREQFK